jgi:hypothetical protein
LIASKSGEFRPVWGLFLKTTYLSVSQAIPDSLYL